MSLSRLVVALDQTILLPCRSTQNWSLDTRGWVAVGSGVRVSLGTRPLEISEGLVPRLGTGPVQTSHTGVNFNL